LGGRSHRLPDARLERAAAMVLVCCPIRPSRRGRGRRSEDVSTTVSQTPFQWYGGKYEIADWLASLLPRATTFVMSFGGAGSPLWHVEPYPVEVYNDIDGDLVNFFRVCRDDGQQLADSLEMTPYAREEYKACLDLTVSEPVERARRFAAVARMSHGGAWGRSWSHVVGHSRRGMSSSVSRFLHLPQTVLEVAARLKTVQVESMDAVELMKKYDRPDTLFYCDPPYMPETRNGSDVYRHEYDRAAHETFLATCNACKGKVSISGYDCEMYRDALSKWRRVEREVTCRSNITNRGAASKPTRQEVVWMNYSDDLLPFTAKGSP
jgi:DNA adenine methylase